ncbi:unnamed protein product [Ectocarpus sp. 6 AP-2014]
MFSLASSESSTIVSSAGGDYRAFKPGPLLVAGEANPRRPKSTDHEHRQLLRLTGFKEEDVELMKVLFDMYDRDRDGMLTVEEACLLCTTLGYHPVESSSIRSSENGRVAFRQFIQSAGFVRGSHVPPTARGGHTKHFFRMANRSSSTPMGSKQARLYSLETIRTGYFFQSIGVGIPLPAVERITATIGNTGDPTLMEEELVSHVAYIQSRQDALSQKSSTTTKGGAGPGSSPRKQFAGGGGRG